MISFLSDLWRILKGTGLWLDKKEAAALGAPNGDTISIWIAMKARHGNALAHIACLALWLVQFHHCQNQLAGVPMATQNYIRATVLLILFTPIAGVVWCVRSIARSIAKRV